MLAFGPSLAVAAIAPLASRTFLSCTDVASFLSYLSTKHKLDVPDDVSSVCLDFRLSSLRFGLSLSNESGPRGELGGGEDRAEAVSTEARSLALESLSFTICGPGVQFCTL